jgi:hypothetical protein
MQPPTGLRTLLRVVELAIDPLAALILVVHAHLCGLIVIEIHGLVEGAL